VIDSAPGHGTTIELWLPVSLTRADAEDVAAVEPKPRRGRGKVLLVDDEELVRMSTGDMLIDLGFEVTEAGSAEEALNIVADGEVYDLLITDHLMPGLSGVELARRLRQQAFDRPVLIVSGYAEAEGVAVDMPRLTKPFRISELSDSISSLGL
jgi:CheY-like chemotaxis protein